MKSQLRQWGPQRALNGRYGSDIHPCVNEHFVGPPDLSGPMISTLRLIATPNNPIGSYKTLPATHPPTYPTYTTPLPPIHPLIHAICDITIVVKKLLKNPAVLASYYSKQKKPRVQHKGEANQKQQLSDYEYIAT